MSLHNGEIASHVGVLVNMFQENVAVVQDVKLCFTGFMAVFRNSCICKMCKCKGIDPMIFFLFQNNPIRQVTQRKNPNTVEKPMTVPNKLLSLTFGYLEFVPSWMHSDLQFCSFRKLEFSKKTTLLLYSSSIFHL